jgi:cell shape-determining protein MreC
MNKSTSYIVNRLRALAKAMPLTFADEFLPAMNEIIRLDRAAKGNEILLREVERLQSENVRLRGLCGLSPKQPIPEMMS